MKMSIYKYGNLLVYGKEYLIVTVLIGGKCPILLIHNIKHTMKCEKRQ